MFIGGIFFIFKNSIKVDPIYLLLYSYSEGNSSILIIIAPLLITLPFASSYIQEKETNFDKNIFMRISRLKYLLIKLFVNGVVGGLTISIILFFSFIVFIILKYKNEYLDLINYFDLSGYYGYLSKSSSYMYAIYIIMGSFFAGVVFSTMSLSISGFIKNKYLSLLFPFFFHIISGIFFIKVNSLFYTANLLNIGYFGIKHIYIIMYEVALLIVFISIFILNGLKE